MKAALTLIALTCALVLGFSLPADAYIVVLGNDLAHDCYTMAKAGINNEESIATCDAALANAPLDPHDRAGHPAGLMRRFGLNQPALSCWQGACGHAITGHIRGIRRLP